MVRYMTLQVSSSVLAALCVPGLVFVASLASANEFLDLSLSGGYEENLPRGYLDKDIHSSEFMIGSVNVGKLFQPATNTSVIVSGSASHSLYFSQHGFDTTGAGIGVTLQQKFGMGSYTPRLALGLSASREDSRGDERDRDLYVADVGFSQRPTAAFSYGLGVRRETSRGVREHAVDFTQLPYRPGVTRPTDPMDYRNDYRYFSADYEFANGWLVTAGYEYLTGYVVSSAVPPVVNLFIWTEAVALDPAYDSLRLMYLMETSADLWSTSVSIPLSVDTAVDFGYSWQDFDVEYVGGYDNAQFTINLIHRF